MRYLAAFLILGVSACGEAASPSAPGSAATSSTATSATTASGAASATSSAPASPSTSASLPPGSRPIGSAREVVMGGANLCVIHFDGAVTCGGEWPRSTETPTSIGTRNQYFPTGLAIAPLDAVSSVALTDNRGCAVHTDGTVSCWGNTRASANGWFDAPADALPASKVDGISDVASLAVTNLASCAITRAGKVLCWGPSFTMTSRKDGPPPGPRTIAIMDAVQLSGSWKQACAVTKQGKVGCWGDLRGGLLGEVKGSLDETAVHMMELANIEEVSVGTYHACARDRSGAVFCWGSNTDGLLGDGTVEPRKGAVAVMGLRDAEQIAVSSHLSCALTREKKVYCWGEDANCDLGSAPQGCVERQMFGTTGSVTLKLCAVPQRIGVHITPKRIAVGATTACAWDDKGNVECWGRNLFGGGLSCDPASWMW
ncbi:MAG: hypothetical protein U0271_15940 [Polyangiaceae bacterium]